MAVGGGGLGRLGCLLAGGARLWLDLGSVRLRTPTDLHRIIAPHSSHITSSRLGVVESFTHPPSLFQQPLVIILYDTRVSRAYMIPKYYTWTHHSRLSVNSPTRVINLEKME